MHVHYILPEPELALHTRCRNQISNETILEGPRYGDVVMSGDIQRQYRQCSHRPMNPSRRYNCHGLSFASRRTWIKDTAEINKILKDDDYKQIGLLGVMEGDLAIYYTQEGDIEHSGLVVGKTALNVPVILSKWGALHEVVHQVPHCPYDAGDVRYYRITT